MGERAENQPVVVDAPAPPQFWAALLSRLAPRGTNILMLSVYIGILVTMLSTVLGRAALSEMQFFGTMICLSTMLALHAMLEDIERGLGEVRAHVLHLAVNSLLFVVASWMSLGAPSFLPYLLFMLAGQAITMFGAWRGLAFALALYLSWIGVLWGRGVSVDNIVDNALSVGMGMLFTTMFCLVILGYNRQREQAEALAAQLRHAHDELAAVREREKELAVAEERIRLARDIHDGLGHHLTVLNVQLQAAAKLVERDPVRAAAAITTSRAVAQAAMEEVRHSVAAMRSTPLDGRTLDAALAALVQEFDARSPLTATFARHGTLPVLPPVVAMTLYRATQEGLTNAQKHAAAVLVEVELTCGPAHVRLTVSDDGCANQTVGSGFGLAGLRERVEQLGGRFTAGPRPGGGFEIIAEVRLTLEP